MSLSDMAHELMAAYASEGRLTEIQCDLLYQCDLDCGHCYLDEKGTRNQDTVFWKGVIDQFSAMGGISLSLSGGEIFLRKDLLELVRHARERGLLVYMKSHAGRITEEHARALAELDVADVQVSLYSMDAAVHDRITRREGSHEATMRGIRALVRHGVPVSAAACVMGPNHSDILELATECESLGVPLKLEFRLQDALGGMAYPQDLALDHAGLTQSLKHLQSEPDACSPGGEEAWSEGKICNAGQSILYVNPEGDVTPCLTWPQALGNLKAGDRLEDIWTSSSVLTDVRNLRNRDREGCGTCDSSASCSYCPGQSYVEHGDPMKPARAVCRDGYARSTAAAHLRGLPEPKTPSPLLERPFRVFTSGQLRGLREAEASAS